MEKRKTTTAKTVSFENFMFKGELKLEMDLFLDIVQTLDEGLEII